MVAIIMLSIFVVPAFDSDRDDDGDGDGGSGAGVSFPFEGRKPFRRVLKPIAEQSWPALDPENTLEPRPCICKSLRAIWRGICVFLRLTSLT